MQDNVNNKICLSSGEGDNSTHWTSREVCWWSRDNKRCHEGLGVENTLNYYRTQVFGHQPRDRESFDPWPVLRSLQEGEKIVVLDSKKDLPNNWRYFDLNSFFNDNQNRILDPMKNDDHCVACLVDQAGCCKQHSQQTARHSGPQPQDSQAERLQLFPCVFPANDKFPFCSWYGHVHGLCFLFMCIYI